MSDQEKITRLIDKAKKLKADRVIASSPELVAWKTQVESFLLHKFGSDSPEAKAFGRRNFSTYIFTAPEEDYINRCKEDLETTILELNNYLEEEIVSTEEALTEQKAGYSSDKLFIVHGHDGELKESVARLIEKQGIEAIILSEQPNTGKTIIEKFEEYSDVGAAIALFTKDDQGKARGEDDLKSRARQNVVFETGYFIGKLGRDRLIIIAEEGVELPSDLQGVVYTNKRDWKLDVCRDLKAMSFEIDFNLLF